ncbi:hypothetical protein C9I50_12190 [Pseudomonas prosekii]|nr:hypothetical protein C9I50_12190 [Pseudomonas prosekii]
MGASLLAMAPTHSTSSLADPPLSRASLAPTVDRCRARNPRPLKIPCGSEPARDGANPISIFAD